MPFFPDCYDEWGLYQITYDGDHKMYEMLFEGTEEECRQYAYDNYTPRFPLGSGINGNIPNTGSTAFSIV